jgi:hypothetical protein
VAAGEARSSAWLWNVAPQGEVPGEFDREALEHSFAAKA